MRWIRGMCLCLLNHLWVSMWLVLLLYILPLRMAVDYCLEPAWITSTQQRAKVQFLLASFVFTGASSSWLILAMQLEAQHLNLRLPHQDHPTKLLWPVGVSQCKESISRLGCPWNLLLRLDNEGHRWEGLWRGCPCTKGYSPTPGHPGTMVYDNINKKPPGCSDYGCLHWLFHRNSGFQFSAIFRLQNYWYFLGRWPLTHKRIFWEEKFQLLTKWWENTTPRNVKFSKTGARS